MKNKNQFKHYRCLIPSGIDLATIVHENPPDFETDLGLLTYLVHLAIGIPAKNNDLLGEDGYVPFQAKMLQAVSREYRLHLDYLVEHGVLEEYRQYIVSKKCRRFRIAEKYLSNRLKNVTISDPKLLRVLDRSSNIDFHATIKYKDLYQWLDPDRLKIDVQAAEDYIYAELDANKDKSYYEAYLTAYTKLLKVKMIDEGAFWFNVDDKGHRLHTNFTNLNKDLKPFITYDGLPLVSIDVKNSQPFFSLKIVQEKFPLPIPTNPCTLSPNTYPNPIMIVKEGETLDFADVSGYRGEVVRGSLYETLETEMRKEFGDGYFTRPWIYDVSKERFVRNTFTARQIVKGVTYQVYFSKNTSDSKEKKLFRRLYPHVMEVFEAYKDDSHVVAGDRHKRLAWKLQRIEASIILDKVVKEISRLRPNLPIYTIHDCIVTTVGNEPWVKQVMERVITEAMGFAPTLDTQYWCKECEGYRMAA